MSYLEIQQSRYRDIMEFEINIPPELDEVMVPKLTLQPLAENALYHGIKNKRGKGKILIEGFNLGDDMMLRVTDNGQGMTPERLYEVQEAIRTGERAGFGLAAVSERIVLYYGPGYGLKISSTEGEGTVMEVYMAKKLTWITIQDKQRKSCKKLRILTDMQLLLCAQVDKVNYFIVYSYPITVLWPADRDLRRSVK